LITNAIQATAKGGRVTIATARAGDHAEITVADTGSVFRRSASLNFRRLRDHKAAWVRAGTGISKRIVEQLDGDRGHERSRPRHRIHLAVPDTQRYDCRSRG
jgi:signal transduction histidine kinase